MPRPPPSPATPAAEPFLNQAAEPFLRNQLPPRWVPRPAPPPCFRLPGFIFGFGPRFGPFEFRVSNWIRAFRVSGFEFRARGFGWRVSFGGCWVPDFRFLLSGFRFLLSAFGF